jgi:hypothetical protein
MSAAPSTGGSVSRFAGTLIDLCDRVEYRRVSADEQFDPVYRLRYEAYRREDFIPFNSEQIVRDEYDDLPNAYCYGVYIDGELVSSVRFHHLTPAFRRSPNYGIFRDILDPILDAGHIVLDPGRFTADREASLAYPALPFLTLRLPTIAVLHFGAKYCLNSVRPEHGAFYRRVYRSVALSEPRHHHGLSFPVVLYACDLLPFYDDLLRRYPFFRSTAEERAALFGPAGRTKVSVVRPSVRLAQRLAELKAEEEAVTA